MKDWLNQLLNRFSMYRLMSLALTGIWIMAFVLSLVGELPFSPLDLLTSAAVLVLFSYYSNLLFGWLFNVRTHGESTYITAFILFFIFTPSAQPTVLLQLALIAIIASASKYILAVCGRHIFNPAAIAAVIIGLLDINYASWWIGTPTLLPVTLLLGLLILYKTRRLMLGGVFTAVAVPIIIVIAVVNGQSLGAAVIGLGSWPLIFLVGFMFSEPLTLPPRHWQQYLVASIVAILLTVPFHIGVVSISPTTALIIGNAVAFLFTQRRHIALTLTKRQALSNTTDEYYFETQNPLAFTAGQYMEITVPHPHKDGRGIRRVFSIVGAPGQSTLCFGIKTYDRPSSFKKALRTLPIGTVVTATSIGGDFILPKDPTTPLLFVAGGIGITPYISHLLHLQQCNQARDITLVYAVSTIDEIVYADILQQSGIRVIIVTETDQPLPDSEWTLLNKRHLTKDDLLQQLPDIAKRQTYVSGPPLMVDQTKKILKQLHVRRIASDYFTGY